jgi:hypothetical protein
MVFDWLQYNDERAATFRTISAHLSVLLSIILGPALLGPEFPTRAGSGSWTGDASGASALAVSYPVTALGGKVGVIDTFASAMI